MLYVNFRRIILTALFVLGAGTLLLGYSGLVGIYFKDRAGTAGFTERPVQPGSGPVAAAGPEAASNPAAAAQAPGRDGFFIEYRLQRERSRSQQVELLREIANSPSAAGDARQLAQEQLLGISRSVAREGRLENMLKARGYREAVACVDQKGVTVVVESSGFTPAEEARLIELVSRESGVGEQGIVLIPKK